PSAIWPHNCLARRSPARGPRCSTISPSIATAWPDRRQHVSIRWVVLFGTDEAGGNRIPGQDGEIEIADTFLDRRPAEFFIERATRRPRGEIDLGNAKAQRIARCVGNQLPANAA